MKRIRYPWRLTQVPYRANDDNLQAHRIELRRYKLQEVKDVRITRLRKGLCNYPYEEKYQAFLNAGIEAFYGQEEEYAELYGVKFGWDLVMLDIQIYYNLCYAQEKGSLYLLREGLHEFPFVNYVLGEIPYQASAQDRFGSQDFHCVIQGDYGSLIYFNPPVTGFSEGVYVETLR